MFNKLFKVRRNREQHPFARPGHGRTYSFQGLQVEQDQTSTRTESEETDPGEARDSNPQTAKQSADPPLLWY